MQAYDVALKLLLQRPATVTMRELTGNAVEQWLDVELPKIQNLRLDLLGRTVDGGLIQLELQSSNDPAMPFRMLEYCVGVQRVLGQFPRQFVLYVGEAPMRMESKVRVPDLSFQYGLIDIRNLDGDRLLESRDVGDNLIAILAHLRDDKEAVHRIMARIAGLPMAEKETALAQLMILAGLRHLTAAVEQERRNMPIDLDIREHEVLGPMIIAAEQEAELKGERRGELKGERKGELTVLRRLIAKRFGAIPAWAEERLASRSTAQLEELIERVLDAQSIEDLMK
jgi:uncharacterized protein DUF4351